jgi:PAS domain S-box-containing protein
VKKRILIVEDDRITAEQFQQTLAARGYDVSHVLESGEEVMTVASSTRPDLVLMDIVLPGEVDGISAAQHLQTLGVGVIYVTGYSDQPLVDRAQHTEPLAFLSKPVLPGELTAVVQLALFKRDLEREREREKQEYTSALQESEARFGLLVAGVTDYSIFTMDPSGMVTSWNSGAERIMGFAADEIIGQYYGVLFPADDGNGDSAPNELETARKNGAADDTRWLVRKNGERYWAEGTLTAIRDAKDAISGFAKVIRDATARRQMEQTLREREEQLRLALKAARTGTWHWDLVTNQDFIDDSLRRLLGLRPDQEIRTIQDFFDVVHPDHRKQVVQAFDRTLHEGVHLDTEFRVVWPDGTEHWLLDQGEVVRGADDQPLYFSGACVDITERKHAEQALVQSEEQLRSSLKEKEALLKEIHHRVKNNLQVITSLLRLQSQHISAEPTRTLFDEACNRVRAIGRIHELLYNSPDLARIDFGEYLKRLGDDLFSFYGVDKKRVRLSIDATNADLEITKAIPCALIVNELVTNCLKHAFPGERRGVIEIHLGCAGGQCTLAVADDGVGLPEGVNLEQSRSLGLQLIAILAEQIEGSVRLDRSRGTRFAISFPQNNQINSRA